MISSYLANYNNANIINNNIINNHCVIMSNGGFEGVHKKILNILN